MANGVRQKRAQRKRRGGEKINHKAATAVAEKRKATAKTLTQQVARARRRNAKGGQEKGNRKEAKAQPRNHGFRRTSCSAVAGAKKERKEERSKEYIEREENWHG